MKMSPLLFWLTVKLPVNNRQNSFIFASHIVRVFQKIELDTMITQTEKASRDPFSAVVSKKTFVTIHNFFPLQSYIFC